MAGLLPVRAPAGSRHGSRQWCQGRPARGIASYIQSGCVKSKIAKPQAAWRGAGNVTAILLVTRFNVLGWLVFSDCDLASTRVTEFSIHKYILRHESFCVHGSIRMWLCNKAVVSRVGPCGQIVSINLYFIDLWRKYALESDLVTKV